MRIKGYLGLVLLLLCLSLSGIAQSAEKQRWGVYVDGKINKATSAKLIASIKKERTDWNISGPELFKLSEREGGITTAILIEAGRRIPVDFVIAILDLHNEGLMQVCDVIQINVKQNREVSRTTVSARMKPEDLIFAVLRSLGLTTYQNLDVDGAMKSERSGAKMKTADATEKKGEILSMSEKEPSNPVLERTVPGKMRSASDTRASVPKVSGLKAGYSDDNKQFNYFVGFLKKFEHVPHVPLNISERIIFKLQDVNGRTVPNADVEVTRLGKVVSSGKSYADGTYLFFPSEYSNTLNYTLTMRYGDRSIIKKDIDRDGPRKIELKAQVTKAVAQNTPLDIVFIFDTTGSMGEEIERLKKTIELIHMNLAGMPSKPKIRFGMVLYRDRGQDEEYVTKIVPLTSDLSLFQKELEKVTADGGGDEPEDLQSAMAEAVKNMDWNTDGIRLAFIITDATAHFDYGQKYTYIDAAKDAKKKGIKIFSIGTGGLPVEGEYVLRQIAQYTYARYIFLTYGEKGENEGGKEGSVSHHTGDNFDTDKLETVVIRFAKEELGSFTDKPLEKSDEYFSATKQKSEKKSDTLAKLFDMAVVQLVDYSSLKLTNATPAMVVPFSVMAELYKADSEYFTQELSFAMVRNKTFTVVERQEMQRVLSELSLSLAGLTSEINAAKVGKFLGADVIATGTVFKKDEGYEIFLRLINVETAEILSLTKVRISKDLGLGK